MPLTLHNRLPPFTITTILTALFLSQYTRHSLLETHTITGSSMAPTLSPDTEITGRRDHVLFWKRYRLQNEQVRGLESFVRGTKQVNNELRRGMVVSFLVPGPEERIGVKRVVGLEGDEVRPRRRPVSRPSRKIIDDADEILAASKTLTAVADGMNAHYKPLEPVTIPFGHVWVEGDNEDRSRDSNDYGPISKSLIQGVATRILLPRERARKIKFEEDGWEDRIGDRLKKRSSDVEQVPEEWLM